ncbi:MAG: late competence development ComFB family protein [Lachnospiraceae bacterium]|nr:late competence development ComFB family protein [Lachnospiraceae bacterium]
MPKKTNKTDHVLGLLSGKAGAEEDEIRKSAPGAAQTDKEDEKNDGHVQIVSPKAEEDEIADAVKELLEKELSAEESAQAAEPEESASQEAVAETEETMPEEEIFSEPEEASEAVVQEVDEATAAENEEANLLKEAEEDDGEEFRFINVMERLVRDKVPMYMDMFGTCKCSRCMADTIAVTLTHLTPKYVVVSKNAVAPLMNYYSQHYAGQVTVEITKACTLVSERPHHGR